MFQKNVSTNEYPYQPMIPTVSNSATTVIQSGVSRSPIPAKGSA